MVSHISQSASTGCLSNKKSCSVLEQDFLFYLYRGIYLLSEFNIPDHPAHLTNDFNGIFIHFHLPYGIPFEMHYSLLKNAFIYSLISVVNTFISSSGCIFHFLKANLKNNSHSIFMSLGAI